MSGDELERLVGKRIVKAYRKETIMENAERLELHLDDGSILNVTGSYRNGIYGDGYGELELELEATP